MKIQIQSVSSSRRTTTLIALCCAGLVCGVMSPGTATAGISPLTDDFDDNVKDTTKWGEDTEIDKGRLTEVNQRLEFTGKSAAAFDEARRPWIQTHFPYTSDWEVQVDLANTTDPSGPGGYASCGIYIVQVAEEPEVLYGELAAVSDDVIERRFSAAITDGGGFEQVVDTEDLGLTIAALRISFNSGSKVITLFYDTDPSDGYSWTEFASYGVDGNSGDDGNADWGMEDADQFYFELFGYGQDHKVLAGTQSLDNVMVTGGVTPATSFDIESSGVKQKCKTKNEVTTCKLSAKIKATNTAITTVNQTTFRVFRSTDAALDLIEDTLLATYPVGPIKPGKAAKIKVKTELDSNASGEFLLLVDPDDQVLASFAIP